MKEWTMPEVAQRFEEAVKTLRRLPSGKKQGYFNAWPPIVRTIARQVQHRFHLHLGCGPRGARWFCTPDRKRQTKPDEPATRGRRRRGTVAATLRQAREEFVACGCCTKGAGADETRARAG